MTGGGGGRGRFKPRRKALAGGIATIDTTKLRSLKNEGSNSNSEITENSLNFSNITEPPQTSACEFDFFTQAYKALSFHHPFLLEDSQASPPSVSCPNILPSELTLFSSRYSDSRKRYKKSHSGSENKTSAPRRPRGPDIWIETEVYFRQLTVEDIKKLDHVAGAEFLGYEKFFLIPCSENDDNSCGLYEAFNGMLASACDKDGLNIVDEAVKVLLVDEENDPKSIDVENDSMSMDVGDNEVETNESAIKEENIENDEKKAPYFSGAEWLLGSRSKIYLVSSRRSKKKKFLAKDSGLEKLLVAHTRAGSDSVCHYCSYGEMGDPLNCLIKCCSCGMMVHQRCYGVQEEVGSFWSCSWCKRKSCVDLNAERPCLLCPKQGGALKPVQQVGFGSEGDGPEVEFAHLFCCQWMPEVYVENTRSMEPVMNLDKLKNTRMKLICNLCKTNCGVCVSCSIGSCRTSFHPICAREANYRMEIWGKLGSDKVELRAFCSKHSEVHHGSTGQNSGDTSSAGDFVLQVSDQQQMVPSVNESQKLKIRQRNGDRFTIHTETDDMDHSKLNDVVLDGEDTLANSPTSKSYHIGKESVDRTNSKRHHVNEEAVDGNDNKDANSHSALNFTLILKKLIDVGKVDAKDVALGIGVSPDSLNTMLNNNCMAPESHCKLVKWLKNHAHIASLRTKFNVKIKSVAAPTSKTGADATEYTSSVSIDDSGFPDAVPVKCILPRTNTMSNIRIFQDDKAYLSKERIHDDITEGDVNMGLLSGNDSKGQSGESLTHGSQKHQDNHVNDSRRTEEELFRPLAQCHSEDRLTGETKQSDQITTNSLVLINGEFLANSYVHPYIYMRLMQTKRIIEKTASFDSASLRDWKLSQLKASASSGLCCDYHTTKGTSGNWNPECNEEIARNIGMLKLYPQDEVEGELIYYQQRLLCNYVTRKHICDGVVIHVVKSLLREIDAAGKHSWDNVVVSRYNHELRETKKQLRRERRHKEDQAVFAVAVAASSMTSSFRRDTLEESTHQEDLLKINAFYIKSGVYSHLSPRGKETISRSSVSSSLDENSDFSQLASGIRKEQTRSCDLCRRFETNLSPIFVCSSCKVAVHMDCYRNVKILTGPWHCELCEDTISSQGFGALATNNGENLCLIAECGLCGGTAGAFRKSVNGQWIHALCAEWVLESTYKRGQENLIQGMDIVSKGVDACIICSRKQGVCLKCSNGHCQNTFHPTCAKSAGFYMTVRTNGSSLQHKAYCEKHSMEQRAKDEAQKHGIEEFKGLKQVRVELEILRLLCERIIKREKLKRELVLCSHDILASSRDSVLHVLDRHPFYQPAVISYNLHPR